MSVIEHLHKSFVCHFFAPIICEKTMVWIRPFLHSVPNSTKVGLILKIDCDFFGADSRLKTTSLSNYECKCRAVMFVVVQPKVDY